MSRSDVAVAVLAAGRGSRIWPYATVRQKCAMPVANRPLIARIVDELAACGLRNIRVVVGHCAGSVRAALTDLRDTVTYVEQSVPSGTADAALCALYDQTAEILLIVYGDVLVTRRDLAAVLDPVEAGDAEASVLVAPLGRERPGDWISARVEDGALTGVEGHSGDGAWRIGGVFAIRRVHLHYLEDNPGVMTSVPVGGMPPAEAELAESISRMIGDGVAVAAAKAGPTFVDLDKPWHILGASRQAIALAFESVAEDVVPSTCRIHDGAEINGRLILGENVVIGNRVVVKDGLIAAAAARITNGAILGAGAVVGREAAVRDYCALSECAVVGDHGIVAHGAEFAGVMFDRAYLYHYCEISGVLGSAVDIGAATVCGTLRFDDGVTPHRIKGRRECPPYGANASYLGDYTRTGVNAMLMPGVKVGCYSCVGPGVVLYDDLAERKVVLVRQELEFRDWGPEKYGW
ncbi:MAG: NTP transferase domain-containing protein [Kiritimatiellaeota bacterium]|nr:NTP transferase domain-containing protein [Kiritimatiellota bacterium]